MHKAVDVKMTSIFSPICQTLIHETPRQQDAQSENDWLESCTELLIVRLDGTVIAYATFEVIDNIHVSVKSLHFRSIIKDRSLAEFWVSRHLKRYLRKNSYMQFLLMS